VDSGNIVREKENYRPYRKATGRMSEELHNGVTSQVLHRVPALPLIKQSSNNTICFRIATASRNERKEPHYTAEQVDPTVIVEEKPGKNLNHGLTNFTLKKFGKHVPGNLDNIYQKLPFF